MIGLMNLPKSYLCNFGKFVKFNSSRMHNTKSEQYTPIVKLAKTVLIANGMYIHFKMNANQKAIRIHHER